MSRVGGFLLGRGGAVAAGASAGIAAPSSSHCRAQTQSRGGLLTSKGDRDSSVTVNQGRDGGHFTNRLNEGVIDQEWLVTDVHNNHVVFGAEEISEVVNTLMGGPSRETSKAVVGSEVAIHELHEDLSDSDDSIATDANDYMHAAGMQVARANSECDNMVMALNNMLNRPDVQKVVLCALLEDPTVQDLIRDRNRVVGDSFLPRAAQAGLGADFEEVASEVDPEQHAEQEDNSIQRIAERVAANIVNLGQHIRDSAAHLLINLGYQIHQLLGRPFKQAPDEAKAADRRNGKAPQEWLPKVLMTVGCAVITLLLFKRLRIV
ncbi:g9033 [Coccomyxa elongata]